MVKFMNHFVECLRVRLGASDAEEIAKLVFFDFRSLRAGEEWSESLTQALCEARRTECLAELGVLEFGASWASIWLCLLTACRD